MVMREVESYVLKCFRQIHSRGGNEQSIINYECGYKYW